MRSATGARLMKALRPLVSRRRQIAATAGLLHGAALGGVVAAAVIVAAGPEALSSPQVVGALAAAVLAPALARLAWPQDPVRAALAAEDAFPFLQDRVVTAVEVVSRAPRRAATSERMVAHIVGEAAAALEDLPLTRAVPLRSLRRPALGALIGLTVAALAWSATPSESPPSPAPAPAVARESGEPEPRPTPPRLYDVEVRVEPPAYAGMPTRRVTEALDTVRALTGSTITLTARCSSDAATVRVELGPGGARELAPAEGRVTHELRLSAPVRWRLTAADAQGRAATPWRALEPIPDGPPRVRLVRPDADMTLAAPDSIEVAATAADDFGVTALGLRYRLADAQRWRSLPLEIEPGRAATSAARLNLGAVGLQDGGELLLRAWATDNDAVSGPKTALSESIRIRVELPEVTEREDRTPAERAERETEEAMQQLRRAAEDLGRELEEAVGHARGQGAAQESPRTGMELQEAARRLAEQAGRLEAAMGEAERELSAREMVTPEMAEKVRRLHEMMREVLDEEMREALEELRRALQSEEMEQVRMSLEAAREAQQRFMERLEQTLELLRRARMERLLEQLTTDAERLARRQSELTERTEQLPEGQSDEAREAEREQRLLARDTQPLAGRVESAVEQARELSPELAAKLGAIADRLAREDPVGQMRRAASALESGRPQHASGPQQEALQSLQAAAGALGELSEELQSQHTGDARRAISRMIRDALALSQSQEELGEDVRRLGRLRRTDLLRDKRPIDPVRREQTTLSEATGRLAERMRELSGQTPAMDPSLATAAETVAEEMAQAAREIEGAHLAQAMERGRGAMMGMNEVARRLLEIDEQLSQSSAQSTLSQWMQRLQSLGQRQRGLNQQTGEAQAGRRQGQTGRPSLSEMALEQALIREALQRMIDRGGRATKSMADQLGGVPDEMEKVEGELRSGRIERRTVERQEQILEKMLEAQRSLYTKQQERSERQAERPGQWEPPPSPPALSPSLLRAPNVEIERGAGGESLPLGYESFVREYFRRLGEGQR